MDAPTIQTAPPRPLSAKRYGRIIEVCERIHLPARAQRYANEYGLSEPDLENLVHERLALKWKDEWDDTDTPYGVDSTDPESAWTVPKWCSRAADNVLKEALRDHKTQGVTGAPRNVDAKGRPFSVDPVDLNDLDTRPRPGGAPAYLVLMLPLDPDEDAAIRERIGRAAEPLADPDQTWNRLMEAAGTAIRMIGLRTGDAGVGHVLARVEIDDAFARRMRDCVIALVHGDDTPLADLAAQIAAAAAGTGRRARRRSNRQNRRTANRKDRQ